MPANHRVVSRAEWMKARAAFLAKEKEFTRARDALSQARRELPWEAIETDYVFDGPAGKQSLPELFDGRSQLVVYHFMFGPGDKAGCPHCSFWADNFNDVIVHLNHRDTTMVAISRAPFAKLSAYQQRMGWKFKWLSSGGTTFNFDMGASFTPGELEKPVYNFGTQAPEGSDREGISVFFKDDDGRIYRTYATFSRGIDLMNTAYNYLDLTPKGRDEGHRGQFWVRRHDEYR